ncbi:MAG: sodium-dependent transporter [Crenarchaeota archaeon]|nr:MAG: sodium-dependent transporter [Thermoproteota archaeon]RDJ33089.1 MAG: sodium-dependent transporter [Thermoproteota archaeon]RDJ36407.1 MAG: sodium-dependent transporter [Thermoproteota archaeon]RDJ39036.1 MAG: sodium-dependent transporter [Thermoproteota archaeon]
MMNYLGNLHPNFMSDKQVKTEAWASEWGFLLACIGSAVGIGNIWRFPYIVGENGGGAFLIPFIIIVGSLGFILMLLEFAIGRRYKSSIVTGLASISKKFKWAGAAIALVAFAMLSYYLVILGWVLSYFISNLGQSFLEFEKFTQSYYPVLAFTAVLILTFIIVRRGITSGIEKFNKIGILFLIGIIIPLMIYGVTLPGSTEGISYFLKPDFSRIGEPQIWSTAFGQAFFSLSLGSGSLLTYGSYLRGKHSLIRSSSIIISANTMISIFAGIMIFSFVFSFGMDPQEGIPLIFEVLPNIFSDINFGFFVGAIFFFLLLIAGLTSAIGLFQVPNASLQDSFNLSNKKSSAIIAIGIFLVGIPSALSYSPIELGLSGVLFLDGMDYVFGTYGITISELIFVVVVTWFVDKKKILENINATSRFNIPQSAISVVKYVSPLVIIAILVSTAIF